MTKKIPWLYILIPIVAVVVIVLFLLLPQIHFDTLTTDDISVTNFKYGDDTGDNDLYWSLDEDIYTQISFVISTDKKSIHYRVYDTINNVYLFGSDRPIARHLSVGDNKVISSYHLDYLAQQPQIEICISYDKHFGKFSPGVVCRIETFPAPNIDVSVKPDPLTFTISKSSHDPPYKTITVTNTGDVQVNFYVSAPNSYADTNYHKYYPQYMTKTTQSGFDLAPGESFTYSIAPSVGNVGEWDTPIGTYESTGYVVAIIPSSNLYADALFKKEFDLVTTVTE